MHFYVLLGASDGVSSVEIDADPESNGLSTLECMKFLIDMERRYPFHIKVAFAFNYDDNMMFRDLSSEQQKALCEDRWITYLNFRIKWTKGKFLEVKHLGTYTKIMDVFSFYQCKFEEAVTAYLKPDKDFKKVSKGKAKRSTFEYRELETLIRPYMRVELKYLVKLSVTLREYLEQLEVYPNSWHGPGAVANSLLAKHRIRDYRPEKDTPFIRAVSAIAAQYGHFEQYRTGLYDKPVYLADLKSAYPWAATLCPELDTEYEFRDSGVPDDFSLCEIYYFNPGVPRSGRNPFPLRTQNGGICYPSCVKTWVWGVEYKAAVRNGFAGIELLRWIQFSDNGKRPFDFVHDYYEKRRQWIAEGNPVQLAAKLSLNSIFGKLVQVVGWESHGGAPKWHQLRWGGYITACCRSRMLDVMSMAGDDSIAIETDGLLSSKPFDMPTGDGLGEFEIEEYGGVIYIQSGVYFAKKGGLWKKGKTRGFSPNKANIDLALQSVDKLVELRTVQHRFMGLPSARDTDYWRQWRDTPHKVVWGGGGKRFHDPERCTACANGSNWHETIYAIPRSPQSHPYPIPWEVGNTQ